MASVDAIEIEINQALVDECKRLQAEVERLEGWKKEALGVLSPVLDYAHGLKITKPGQSVTQALIDDHMRLKAENDQQQEQGALVDALEAIVRQYPNPNLTHEQYRVNACKQAEHALEDYRGARAGQHQRDSVELRKLCAERDKFRTAHQQELERHRTTWTQLEQAKREIAQLKGEGQ